MKLAGVAYYWHQFILTTAAVPSLKGLPTERSLIARALCPVCYGPTRLAGRSAYYTTRERFYTPVFYCKPCGLYHRVTSTEHINDHIKAASYVQLSAERRLYENRRLFFEYLLDMIEHHFSTRPSPIRLCDFGSSYGHLLELAGQRGFIASGVEANHKLLNWSIAHGLHVVESVANVRDKVDVITMIDSLYYLPEPVPILRSLLEKLRLSGFIMIRITNRNWLASLRSRLCLSTDFSILGDAVISYSMRGLTRLLNSAGLVVRSVVPDNGVGKRAAFFKTLVYKMLAGITVASGHRLLAAPGLIVIAERPSRHEIPTS